MYNMIGSLDADQSNLNIFRTFAPIFTDYAVVYLDYKKLPAVKKV